MGVVNYYSVGGEIIGERSGGVRTDYLRDALGSVTATKRTDRGTISNTYRYKPYGERLAKTGVAADPRFQWVGTAGYRETAISHSKSYVRARHLGQEEGRWTTVDRWWPIEEAFQYAECRVVQRADPTGNSIDWIVKSGPEATNQCGGVLYWIEWVAGQEEEGWIVQHIISNFDYNDCIKPIDYIPSEGPICRKAQNVYEHWEAWKLDKGNVVRAFKDLSILRSVHDKWEHSGPSASGCSSGLSVTQGFVKLVPDKVFKKWNFKPGSLGCAGDLHARLTAPPGWTDSDSGRRWLIVEHGCCCHPTKWPGCPPGPFMERPWIAADKM